MLEFRSAQANVVCVVGVEGKEGGFSPPWVVVGMFCSPSAVDGPQNSLHAKQMLNHRTISLHFFLSCSSPSTRLELHPKAEGCLA